MEQKAKELCLAFMKIAVYMRRHELKRRFEAFALELLEKSALHDREGILRLITVLEHFVDFANTIYEIEPLNADILKAELSKLRMSVREIENKESFDKDLLPDITSIFQDQQKLFDDQINREEKVQRKQKSSRNSEKAEKAVNSNENIEIAAKDNAAINLTKKNIAANMNMALPQDKITDINDDAAMRQSAIVERIRQSGNMPIYLKDIVNSFPKFSERTLRYDLQRLCSQGVIERVGAGGRNSYYKARII